MIDQKDDCLFFDNDNQKEILNNLAYSAVAIRKEASALQALSAYIEANTY